MIELRGITRKYAVGANEVSALDGVDLLLQRGEYAAVIGPSGSGKTTLFHILGLLARPDGGTYRLAGQDVSSFSERRLASLRGEFIGFVFQNFYLNPRYTALENVELPLMLAGVGRSAGKRIAMNALERVGLRERANHLPRELSGGQQQRVAFARATVRRPPFLLADEPTGNLDPAATRLLLSLLEEEHHDGATILMITHDLSAAKSAERVITIEEGRITKDEKQT